MVVIMVNFRDYALLFFLLMLLLGCGDKSSPSLGALKAVGSANHTFAPSGQDEEINHTFVLKNDANVPVFITGVRSSCGCTWVANKDSFVGSVLTPGEVLDFPVFVSTANAMGKVSGRVLISYRYQTCDLRPVFENNLLLEVTAPIMSAFRIEPPVIDFGNIDSLGAQYVTAMFRVIPNQSDAFEVKDIRPSVGLLATKVLSSKESCYEIEVRLCVSSFTEDQFFSGHVVVETNCEVLPKAVVPVRARYVAPVVGQPSAIVISSEKEGSVKKEVFVVTSLPSQIVRVAHGSSGFVRVEFDSEGKTGYHVVVISVDPCPMSEIDEKISLELMLFPPDGKSIEMSCPVSIYRFKKGESK
ncbi:MAG: DUF1573 domain-containing protein [Planctomycetaceae bacterium]|jgi:hypothetical protein|nr:DUF1573 domain-containing protein [Planctomycetaceae bacterium]